MKLVCTLLLLLQTSLFAQDIIGWWKAVDEHSGEARCLVAIYAYKGLRYGRIIGTYDENGKMKDDIYKQLEKAPGVVGNPPYCGLDLIWDLEEEDGHYYGKILDPEKGNVYRAELWREGDDLIVRGKLLFFFRNQTWLPATNADFPKGFKKPDPTKFIPVIPEVK